MTWTARRQKLLTDRVPAITSGSIAGWSSLVARRAHNPKVAGSNPAPATLPSADLVSERDGKVEGSGCPRRLEPSLWRHRYIAKVPSENSASPFRIGIELPSRSCYL